MKELIISVSVFFACVIFIRTVYSFFNKSNYKSATRLYSNKKMAFVYLFIFILESVLLLTQINIYEYFLAFITFGALFLDYFNTAVIPESLKETLHKEISTPKRMSVYIVVGLAVSLAVILHFAIKFLS